MSCEIIQNWVGNLENIFYVCKVHKCECSTAHYCPKSSPSEVVLEGVPKHTPWWKTVGSGDVVICTSLPPVGHWSINAPYRLVMDYEVNKLSLPDEDGNLFAVHDSITWMNYFQLLR